jgi:hypothetical protein
MIFTFHFCGRPPDEQLRPFRVSKFTSRHQDVCAVVNFIKVSTFIVVHRSVYPHEALDVLTGVPHQGHHHLVSVNTRSTAHISHPLQEFRGICLVKARCAGHPWSWYRCLCHSDRGGGAVLEARPEPRSRPVHRLESGMDHASLRCLAPESLLIPQSHRRGRWHPTFRSGSLDHEIE